MYVLVRKFQTFCVHDVMGCFGRSHEIYWFGQNSDSEYGEFRSDSVQLVKETKADTPTRSEH